MDKVIKKIGFVGFTKTVNFSIKKKNRFIRCEIASKVSD